VLYLTTGIPSRELLWPRQVRNYAGLVARRREESIEAASLMALRPVGFLEIPSRHLILHLDVAAAAIERAIEENEAECLWVPAFEGAHQDHDATNALAARLRDDVDVWEFATYNFAGGKVRSNRFADARGGVVELRLVPEERALKREALSLFASQRGNLGHIKAAEEAYRPLPHHDYGARPHEGKLFRERFHWVPFRHPRVDFTPSAEVYAALGRWAYD
jgi:LmbE family N-acetylglucosaminyl deacetylase